MKKLSLLLLAIISVIVTATASDYSLIRTKAIRFYNQKEWGSASAMFTLMLDRCPDSTATYAMAITSAGMRGDTGQQMMLLDMALRNKIEFDSLFQAVKQESFAHGNAMLYEKFLLAIKENKKWTARTVDNYLLKYYIYRRNGEKMIEYSKLMLAGRPDSESFLYSLAQGYLTIGDFENAMATYDSILQIDAAAYDALLYLGNYYSNTGNNPRATDYLERAYAIHPTPYVKSLIDRLRVS